MDDDLPPELAAEERAAQPMRRYQRESKVFTGIGLLFGVTLSIALATQWLPWFLAHDRDRGVRDLLDSAAGYIGVFLILVPGAVGGTLGMRLAWKRYVEASNLESLSEDGTPTTAWSEVVRAVKAVFSE